jgi:HPt (histidine-containing phosphotransfer) domain-containing protein
VGEAVKKTKRAGGQGTPAAKKRFQDLRQKSAQNRDELAAADQALEAEIAARRQAEAPLARLDQNVAEECTGEHSDPAQQMFHLDEALASLAGEEDLFRQMVSFFFDDGPKQLSEMQAAWEHSDAATIGRAAHRLKGTVIYLGAKPVLQALERLERVSGPDDLPLAARLLAELEGRLAALGKALVPYHDAQRPY